MFNWQAEAEAAITTPPILRVGIRQPPARPDYDTSKESVEQIAQRILDRERSRIMQWALGQRQLARTSQLAQVRVQGTFSQATAIFTRAQRTEQLDVTLYPVPPLKSGDDELQLLILHNNNKITAVPMRMLDSDKPWSPTLQKPLRESDWGDKLIKVAQYTFSKVDKGVIFSPLLVTDNVITKAETHHLTCLKTKMRNFLASSTLNARNPHMNGGQGVYYTANDCYTMDSDIRYGGAAGNGETPTAISTEGSYYYKPNVWADMFSLSSYEMQEVIPVGSNLTDENIETLYASTGMQGPFAAPYLTQAEIGPVFVEGVSSGIAVRGASGYGVWVQGSYLAVYKTSATIQNQVTGAQTPYRTDLTTSLPLSVLTQDQGEDTLSVSLSPIVVTHAQSNDNLPGSGGTLIDVSATVLHVNYVMNKPSGPYPPTPHGEPFDPAWATTAPYYRTWAITYPPALSAELGGYYFASDAVVATPYAPYDYTINPPKNNNPLIMRHEYAGWLNLSNGKVVIQGFQVEDAKYVWYRGRDEKDNEADPRQIADQLGEVIKGSVDDIQALIIDVPLARIKEFV